MVARAWETLGQLRGKLATLSLEQAALLGLAFWMEWASLSMFRASGDCKCPECGEVYRRHPFTPHRAFGDGDPYLHLRCNGEVVKL